MWGSSGYMGIDKKTTHRREAVLREGKAHLDKKQISKNTQVDHIGTPPTVTQHSQHIL